MRRLLPLFFWLLFPLSLFFPQDVNRSQLLLIPGILNEFEQSINNLEENTSASNRIISDLRMKVSAMSNTIEMQQRQLSQGSQNYQNLEQTAREKFSDYEASLTSLETSYKTSLTEIQNLRQQNKDLLLKVAKRDKALIVLGGVLGLAIAGTVVLAVLKIKKL